MIKERAMNCIVYVVICDGCAAEAGTRPYRDEARELAGEQGWKQHDDLWLCPECDAAHAKAAELASITRYRHSQGQLVTQRDDPSNG